MKKFLFLLALCPVLCCAQQKEYAGTNIKYCPSALGIFPFQAIQFSVEQDLSYRFSLQAEFGYGINLSTYTQDFTHLADTQLVKPLGLKANIELRYYFLKRKTDHYLSLTTFYRYHLTNGTIEYVTAADSFTTLYDGIAAKKNTWGVALGWGLQKRWGWFVVNPFVGMGVLYRTVEPMHMQFNPGNGDRFPDEIEWHLADEFQKGYLRANAAPTFYFTMGVRLGYAFRRQD